MLVCEMRVLRRLAAALVVLPYLSYAFPTGAGGCDGGVPAVGGSHITAETVELGALSDGNFVVRIDGQALTPNIPMDIPVGVDLSWEVTGNDAFRGFLLRLDGGNDNVDTTSSLAPNPGQGGTVQVAESVCVDLQGVGGVTQRSRALQSSASGRLIVDEASQGMNLDVTIVVENRNQVSEYYYTGYVLNAVEQVTTLPPQDGDDDDDDDDDDDEGESVPVPAPTDPSPTFPPPTNPLPTFPPPTSPLPTFLAPTNPLPTFPAPTSPAPALTNAPQSLSPPPYVPTDLVPTADDDVVEYGVFPSSAPLPILEDLWPQCSVNETCGVCQGDCDSDLECEGNLACFQRDDWDESFVPGCEGRGWMGADYCYDPIQYPNALQLYPEDCSEENPCGKCKGDCDVDTQCAGQLECFQRDRNSNMTVPGCYGLGLPGKDYCFDRADMVGTGEWESFTFSPTQSPSKPLAEYTGPDVPTTGAPTTDAPTTDAPTSALKYEPTSKPTYAATVRPPTNAPTTGDTLEPTMEGTYEQSEEGTYPASYEDGDSSSNELTHAVCSSHSPCNACQGDCDYDSQCAGDLECFPRRVGDYTPIPGCSGRGYGGHDYCYKADPNTLRPRITPCSPEDPCGKCQGDCDSEADCAGNLKCFQRETGDGPFVPGCQGRGVANVDYCFDPADIQSYYEEVSKNGNGRKLRKRN